LLKEQKMKTSLEQISVTDIILSGNNPRAVNGHSRAFLDLVDSVRKIGVIVPVHVRVHPKESGKYELLAGERRYKAALMIAAENGVQVTKEPYGLQAINHGAIGDDEAFEITFIENFAREDLTVLEQGRAVAILLEKYHGDVKAVASKLGKPISWVLQRRMIDKGLIKQWRELFGEAAEKKTGSPATRSKKLPSGTGKTDEVEDAKEAIGLTAGHLQLIASMPAEVQKQLFEAYETDWQYNDSLPTVAELTKIIADSMRLLSIAKWDVDDAGLVKEAGECSKCLKRTDRQPGLFDDVEDLEEIKKNARCMDGDCWMNKSGEWLLLREKELRSQHTDLVLAAFPDDKPDWNEKHELENNFKQEIITGDWKRSEEGKKDTVPALIVHGPKAGELRWIVPASPPVSSRTKANGGDAQGAKASGKSMKVKREMLDKKRWSVVIRKVSELVGKAETRVLVCDDKTSTVMALTATFGTTFKHDGTSRQTWKNFGKLEDEKQPQILETLWLNIRQTLSDNLIDCSTPITQTKDSLIEDAKATARLIGADIDKLFEEACEEYKEPRSWKTEDRGQKTADPASSDGLRRDGQGPKTKRGRKPKK
jgi:ParB/RepB/Spo0J family partition protein